MSTPAARPQTPLEPKRRSNGYLAAIFFAPTAIIIALGIVLILSLLKTSALRLDESQQSAERRLAQSVITTLVSNLQKSTADYANWDDMYDQFSTGPDPQWVKENLGPYAIGTFGLSHILVLSGDSSTRYGVMSRSSDAVPDPSDIDALADVVQSVMRDWRSGVFTSVGGTMSIDGKPHLVAVSPIAVNSEMRLPLQEQPQYALAFLQGLDDARLATLADDFGLMGLRTAVSSAGDLSLASPLGPSSPFSLTWDKSQLGSQFVGDAMPSILLVGVAVIFVFIILGFVWAMIVGRIRDAARAAERASRSKGLFVANMTHELRTPLNAIIGFSELMSREAYGPIGVPKYKEYALDIVSSGHHLLGVVNNILLFSKLEAKRQDVQIERVDLTLAVSDVVRIMQVEAARRHVNLVQETFDAKAVIDADPQALKQILFNVLGNAIKFSDPGELVRVVPVGAMPDGTFKLQIIDRGCGIPKEMLSQLGEAFVQAENTFARKHQGTGLGLAICFGLAAQIRASIDIASTEYVGTTVSLNFPLSELDKRSAPEKPTDAATPPSGPWRRPELGQTQSAGAASRP